VGYELRNRTPSRGEESAVQNMTGKKNNNHSCLHHRHGRTTLITATHSTRSSRSDNFLESQYYTMARGGGEAIGAVVGTCVLLCVCLLCCVVLCNGVSVKVRVILVQRIVCGSRAVVRRCERLGATACSCDRRSAVVALRVFYSFPAAKHNQYRVSRGNFVPWLLQFARLAPTVRTLACLHVRPFCF
jgi:hypothetical protein